MKEFDQALKWACEKILQAAADGGYSVVSVRIENGRIKFVRREDTYLPPQPGRLVEETGRS